MLTDDWMSRNRSELLKAIRVAKDPWSQRQNRNFLSKTYEALDNIKNFLRIKSISRCLISHIGRLIDSFMALHE